MAEIIIGLIEKAVVNGATWALSNPEMAAILVIGVAIRKII